MPCIEIILVDTGISVSLAWCGCRHQLMHFGTAVVCKADVYKFWDILHVPGCKMLTGSFHGH